jgi:hypothetical protein
MRGWNDRFWRWDPAVGVAYEIPIVTPACPPAYVEYAHRHLLDITLLRFDRNWPLRGNWRQQAIRNCISVRSDPKERDQYLDHV